MTFRQGRAGQRPADDFERHRTGRLRTRLTIRFETLAAEADEADVEETQYFNWRPSRLAPYQGTRRSHRRTDWPRESWRGRRRPTPTARP